MIKQAGILLTLCATSLVIINIRTLETVERSGRGIDDDDPYNDKDDYEVRRGTGYRVGPLDMMSELIIKVKKWAKKEYKQIYVDDVDFYESLQGPDDEPDKFLSDGVHPRNKGYAKMAQVAASGLRKFRAESGLEPELTRRPTQKPTTVKPTKRPKGPKLGI